MSDKVDFKKGYPFPLKIHNNFSVKVFTSTNSMAFDFPLRMLYPNGYTITDKVKVFILSVLNGEGDISRMGEELKLRYQPDNSTIYVNIEGEEREFIIVRGWGNLTGAGGLNLPEKEAAEIQDAFGNYIVESLTKK